MTLCLISVFLEFYRICTSLMALFLVSWCHRFLIFISVPFNLCLNLRYGWGRLGIYVQISLLCYTSAEIPPKFSHLLCSKILDPIHSLFCPSWSVPQLPFWPHFLPIFPCWFYFNLIVLVAGSQKHPALLLSSTLSWALAGSFLESSSLRAAWVLLNSDRSLSKFALSERTILIIP